jgi:O-antigen ligase
MNSAWLRLSNGRLVTARVADMVALTVTAVFFWRLLLSPTEAFVPIATAAACAAIAAAVLARSRVSTVVDGPVLVFVGLTLLSAVVNHGRYESSPASTNWFTSWKPAIDVLVRALLFYGLASLLSTERRLGAFIAFFVCAASVYGVQTYYDHMNHGWGTRLWDYRSVPTWSGYPQIATLFAIAFALTLPVIIVSRSPGAVLASALVALVLVFDLAFQYSRSSYISAAATFVVLAIIECWKLKSRRLIAIASAGICLVVAVAVTSPGRSPWLELVSGPRYYDAGASIRSRIAMWTRALALIRDHPGLGVGPGNYTSAVERIPIPGPALDPYAVFAYNAHAHNMLIHVTAESGVPAIVAFLLIWWRISMGLLRVCARSARGVLALALFGALSAFFVRSLSDYLMRDGMRASERMGLLLWALLAAAAAATRLPERGGRETSDASVLA